MSRNFGGTDDLITCPVDDTYLKENGAVSAVIWVKATTLANTLFRRTDGASGNVAFLYAATGRLRYFIGGATGFERQTADSTAVAGRWQAIAITHDGSTTAANCHIYLDLVEPSYGTTTNGNLPNNNSTASLTIGNNAALTSDFSGKLAYLQIWNRVISFNEIVQATYYPGSISRSLRVFLLGGGSPEPDYSGNGNHGTVTGATVSTDNPPINGVFHPPRPNLYYSSFSSAVVTSATATIHRMMLMGAT